jgi:hypothetical protein
MEGQRNTRHGSSGRPGALLQISYVTGEFALHNFLEYYFGTGKDDELLGSIPGDTITAPIIFRYTTFRSQKPHQLKEAGRP